MIDTLIAVKKSMTSTYDARGRRVGATVLGVGSNYVTQIKTVETKDGYNAVQLAYGNKKSTNKPQIGQAKKAGLDRSFAGFKEIRTEQVPSDLSLGQEIKPGKIFSVGDEVKVTGVSKGRGFQGGVRRHGFAGGPKTHGQSDRHRAPGSIGQTTTPGRVYKGKRMAGHMGVDTVSVRGLEVVAVDRQNDTITVKGAVPGYIGGVVSITKLGRIKGYTPPPEPEAVEEESVNQEDEVKIEDQEQNKEEN